MEPAAVVVEAKGPEPRATAGLEAERERRAALLAALKARHDAECPHCTKAKGFTQTVFGEGDPCAALMFVGEAPGAEEDRTGRPFVGRAGQKLDDMIKAMGLRREDVFIANVLKARPPDNATPTPEEAERCGPYLREQIGIIAPRVIVTLGKPAANYLLGNRDSMSSMRGRWANFGDIPVMPTFHPAYLLRAYTRENREKVWSDLQLAMTRIGGGA
ncbi:MAG: uracil-DNA glycosylase [Phycisphaerales bacterium]|nr:uracil-DNA glycosylase [Phycisphaerales bacterium]